MIHYYLISMRFAVEVAMIHCLSRPSAIFNLIRYLVTHPIAFLSKLISYFFGLNKFSPEQCNIHNMIWFQEGPSTE
jgi:hypothetical protein